jgi:hypothetical protein
MSVPTYVQPQQQPRQSRRTLWIILGVVGGLIVIAGLAFSLLVITGVFTALNVIKQTGPIPARYYLAIIDQDYAQAYSYVDSNATINGQQVDQQAFTNLATAADHQNGRVTGFDLKGDENDPSHMTVTVSRGTQSYDVHLLLKQENGAWKIISADGI